MHWYFDVLRKYAVFSGRARRMEYWMWTLISSLFGLALWGADYAIWDVGSNEFGLLNSLYSLAVLLPHIAVSVRRLHDIDKPGWRLLLILIPIVGSIILLVYLVRNGQSGENKYGSDPKIETT